MTYFLFILYTKCSLLGGWSVLWAGHFSTQIHTPTKPCFCNCSMCILHCPAEIHMTFPEIVPSKTCKLLIPYALMHSIPSEMLASELNTYTVTCWKVSLFCSQEDTFFVMTNKHVKFGFVWPYSTSLYWIVSFIWGHNVPILFKYCFLLAW